MPEENNNFSEFQDGRMKEVAEKIMDTKSITKEQLSETIGWLIMSTLTMKKALWSKMDLHDAIDARITKCSQSCDRFKTACDAVERILSKPWPWIACFSPFLPSIIDKISILCAK